MKKSLIIIGLLLSISFVSNAQFRRGIGCPYQQRLSIGKVTKSHPNRKVYIMTALVFVASVFLTTKNTQHAN
jgi:hypothetical protein